MLHPQVGVFFHLAQGAIDSSDREQWVQVTNAFMELWTDCSPEVENALNVSFLENLNFTDGKKGSSWAYDEMPNAMRRAWDDMEECNRKIHGG